MFWVHASNAAHIKQGYQDIADQVKLAGRNDPQADMFELVHNWLRNEKNGKWLLVLDNADDAAALSLPTSNGQKTQASSGDCASPRYFLSYLPQNKNGSVIHLPRGNREAWVKAGKMSRMSMRVRMELFSKEHVETLSSIAMVGLATKLTGRWKEAGELEVQVMETSKTVLGEEHSDTLTSMTNLAFTLKGQGRDDEAKVMPLAWKAGFQSSAF